MHLQIPELLSHFRCTAVSQSNENGAKRAFAEIKHWDARNNILWLKFHDAEPHNDQPSMLKCINKEENLYVIIKGNFEQGAARLHYIKNAQPPLRAFFVTGIMVAKNAEAGTNVSDLKIINRIDLRANTSVSVPAYSQVV